LTLRRVLVRLTAAVLVGSAILGASVWLAGSILVQPTNHEVRRPPGFDANPVSIPAPGHFIAGWWANTGGSSPVVLLLHGIRDDRATMAPRAQLLRANGFSTLLIDLQGHGETPGTEITFRLRESADVVAALAWIKKEAPGRRVGVVGCSMGDAAVLLAPQPLGFDAVVLEEVYPRIGRAVENRIRLRVGGFAPMLTRLLLWQPQPRLKIAPSALEPFAQSMPWAVPY
jgi:pimeloyl-ACP methyl ester carboxylesterase